MRKKRNKLRRNDERNTTQHQTICNKINVLTKDIKKISKENTTRQQMKLIDKLNQAKKGNNFWKAAKLLVNQNQKHNEQLPMNYQEAAVAFTEKLKTTMKTNESKTHKGKDHEKIISLQIREISFKAIKLSECEWIHTEVKPSTLKNLLGNRENTAPGHDGISYQMIKQLPLEALENLSQTIETSLQLGHVPAQWKISTVTVIPKGEKDHKTLKGYRQLSLTSCLLVNHCEKLNLFGDQQSAYRSGRCTTDNLLTLTEKATTSFKWKGARAAAFLDVEQAFDSVCYEGILYKQIEVNTPWGIKKWTSSFLSNRKIKVKYSRAISKNFTPEAWEHNQPNLVQFVCKRTKM